MTKKFLTAIVSIIVAAIMSVSSVSVFAAGEVSDINTEKESVDTIINSIDEQDNTVDENTDPSEDAAETDPSEPETVTAMSGDINGDKVVNINDATEYQLILAGKKAPTKAITVNGDTCSDGKFNILDVTAIQYYVAKVFVKLPVTADGYYAEIIRP